MVFAQGISVARAGDSYCKSALVYKRSMYFKRFPSCNNHLEVYLRFPLSKFDCHRVTMIKGNSIFDTKTFICWSSSVWMFSLAFALPVYPRGISNQRGNCTFPQSMTLYHVTITCFLNSCGFGEVTKMCAGNLRFFSIFNLLYHTVVY